MIRVLIADDHNLVREGIRVLLEKAQDLEVVGEAIDGQEAVDLAQRLAPDVLVMDIAMPQLNGIQAAEQLGGHSCNTRIVILSMYSDDLLVREALKHGVKGFLPKGSVSQELLLAIRAANQGAVYLSPAVSNTVLTNSGNLDRVKGQGPGDPLTPREREIAQLIGKGHTNNQMAAVMGISAKTVERHRTNLMAKLNARNLVELIRNAMKHGLIRLDD